MSIFIKFIKHIQIICEDHVDAMTDAILEEVAIEAGVEHDND